MTERSLLEQRTVALAGVAQAARIVDLAAKTGSWPLPFVEASIHSLFSFDPEGVETVFGTPQGIRLGLEQLSACLGLSQDEAGADTLRYTLAISAAGAPLCREGRPAGDCAFKDSSTQPTRQKISPVISMG